MAQWLAGRPCVTSSDSTVHLSQCPSHGRVAGGAAGLRWFSTKAGKKYYFGERQG